MAQQSAYTTVTLRRLPQGETLQIMLSSNKALNIIKNKDTGEELPVLSTDNSIDITPKVYGTSGTKATLSDYNWTLDGVNPSTMKDFVFNIIDSGDDIGTLQIQSSPIGKTPDTTLHPILIRLTARATLNGHSYSVEKTVTLNCVQTSDNSYWGAIEASNGTTLDETTSETNLIPELYLGTVKSPNTFTVNWYKTGAGDIDPDTGLRKDILITDSNIESLGLKWGNEAKTQLTVTRDGVDTSAHFEAHFLVGGNEVEAEGVAIADLTDEVQLINEGNTFCEINKSITIKVKAYSKNLGNQLNVAAINSVVASDSLREHTFPREVDDDVVYKSEVVTESDKQIAAVTSYENMWYVPNNDSATMVEKPWIKCGDSEADDTPVATKSEATQCEMTLLVGVDVTLND